APRQKALDCGLITALGGGTPATAKERLRYARSNHGGELRVQRTLALCCCTKPRGWRGNGTSERHRGHAPLALVLSDRRGDLGRDRGGGRFRVRIGSRNGDHFCRRRCRICRRKLRLLPCQGDTTDQMVSARKLKRQLQPKRSIRSPSSWILSATKRQRGTLTPLDSPRTPAVLSLHARSSRKV